MAQPALDGIAEGSGRVARVRRRADGRHDGHAPGARVQARRHTIGRDARDSDHRDRNRGTGALQPPQSLHRGRVGLGRRGEDWAKPDVVGSLCLGDSGGMGRRGRRAYDKWPSERLGDGPGAAGRQIESAEVDAIGVGSQRQIEVMGLSVSLM